MLWVRCPIRLSCCAADAVIYLRGASETTHYLHYMAASAPAATANFSVLAPLVGQEQQYVVRDTPSSSSSCALLFAVLYTPDALNGQLVVTQLKPNALANASALLQRTSSSGTEHGSGRGGTSEQAGTACGGGQRRHHTLLQPHDSMVEIVDLTGTRVRPPINSWQVSRRCVATPTWLACSEQHAPDSAGAQEWHPGSDCLPAA